MALEDLEEQLKARGRPTANKPLTSEQIRNYNEQPEVEQKGVKLVSQNSERFKNILLILLTLAVIIFGIFGYLAYKGELDLINLTCPDSPACPSAPACPAIPSCPQQICSPLINLTCPDFNPNITIKLVNSSI